MEFRRYGLVGFTLVAAGVCIGLGLWQGRRLEARRALNALVLARRDLPPVNLNAVSGTDDRLNQRRVSARGSYDHGNTIVLRGRVERETPGVLLVTPIRLEGRSEAVLVLRGFVPAHDAVRFDARLIGRPEGATVSGIALDIPVSPDSGGPVLVDGSLSFRRLDLPALRTRLPYPILPVYLHATEETTLPPALPRPVQGAHPTTPADPVPGAAVRSPDRRFPIPARLPSLDDGPHLSYMIQWFGIAAVALGFGIAMWRREQRSGRRE